MSKIEEALTDYWGEKCPDFDPECPCCQAWKEYEELIVDAGGRLEEHIQWQGSRLPLHLNFRHDN